MEKRKISYVCYLNSSGYSQAAQDAILALHNSGNYDISITPIHKDKSYGSISKGRASLFEVLSKKDTQKDAIRIFHCIPDQQKRFARHDRNIAFATFETFDPPDHWTNLLNRCNGVICPSLFNYDIFLHKNIKSPVFYIQHCIDTKLWNDRIKRNKNNDSFVFLFMGTWRKRKGWTQLIEAWCNEFTSNDNVSLVIKTDKTAQAQRDVSLLIDSLGKKKKDLCPIFYENKIFNDEEMPYFCKSADCLISPTLGEGFGLCGLQCMAVRVPVIITNFAGCKDYAKPDNSFLLEPSGFLAHDCLDAIPQFSNRKWPRIPVAKIQEMMRFVINNPKEVEIKTEKAYNYVQSNFSYNIFVNKFDEMMESIYNDKI